MLPPIGFLLSPNIEAATRQVERCKATYRVLALLTAAIDLGDDLIGDHARDAELGGELAQRAQELGEVHLPSRELASARVVGAVPVRARAQQHGCDDMPAQQSAHAMARQSRPGATARQRNDTAARLGEGTLTVRLRSRRSASRSGSRPSCTKPQSAVASTPCTRSGHEPRRSSPQAQLS
eukprot:6207399-Pleurochrysis_carterae.AAC.2